MAQDLIHGQRGDCRIESRYILANRIVELQLPFRSERRDGGRGHHLRGAGKPERGRALPSLATPDLLAGDRGLSAAPRICLPRPRPREVSLAKAKTPDAPHLHDCNRIRPRRIQVQGNDQVRAPRGRPHPAGHGNRFRGALRLPRLARGEFERGIVLGGSGNGEAIVANRVRGVRCGVCWTEQVAIWNRSHNDGNCLSLGQRTITADEALTIVRTWLATEFEGGRHLARIRKIDGV